MLKDFENCLHNLKIRYGKIYEAYKFPELLTLLDQKTNIKIHSYKFEDLSDKFNQVFKKYGKKIFEEIRKIFLLECAISSWEDIFSEKYPESIQEQYKKNLKRFFQLCEPGEGWGEYIENVYWKDLAIAMQRMIPIGSGIMETFSGFGFRQGLSFNLFQSIQFLKLINTCGGRSGYYQIHTHTPLLEEFTEKGWFQSYIRIAEMLQIHKKIKGVFRSSWFCDPNLKEISPHLSYIQEVPLNGGAKIFHIGEDKTNNPFVKSKTRLKLYKERRYIPQSYLLIWPRKELISWAEQFRNKPHG